MALDKRIQRDVLIIDDDKDICEILREYCHNMGCFKNIVFAHDGIMATQKLRNQKFALILLDMNMPKKSGYDLLSEFDTGSHNPKENILIVSGTLEKDLIAKVLGRGVKTFLVKPFDEPTFQERVLKILSNPINSPTSKA
ncbi:MAG: response regulator [Bacteriovorax sp.]|nr:response regulator [Bacteriovorax sp.]